MIKTVLCVFVVLFMISREAVFLNEEILVICSFLLFLTVSLFGASQLISESLEQSANEVLQAYNALLTTGIKERELQREAIASLTATAVCIKKTSLLVSDVLFTSLERTAGRLAHIGYVAVFNAILTVTASQQVNVLLARGRLYIRVLRKHLRFKLVDKFLIADIELRQKLRKFSRQYSLQGIKMPPGRIALLSVLGAELPAEEIACLFSLKA